MHGLRLGICRGGIHYIDYEFDCRFNGEAHGAPVGLTNDMTDVCRILLFLCVFSSTALSIKTCVVWERCLRALNIMSVKFRDTELKSRRSGRGPLILYVGYIISYNSDDLISIQSPH